MALARCLSLIFHKHLVEFRRFMHKRCYHLSPLGGIGSIGDIWSSRGKPFFFLDLDPFPWRVAQHHIKATNPARLLVFGYFVCGGNTKYVGEGQMPVEELIL